MSLPDLPLGSVFAGDRLLNFNLNTTEIRFGGGSGHRNRGQAVAAEGSAAAGCRPSFLPLNRTFVKTFPARRQGARACCE